MKEEARSFVRRTAAGKTLKLDVIVSLLDDRIVEVVISGDFFAYPPEKLEELEMEIKGKPIEEALKVVDSYEGKVKIVGASLQDIKQLLQQAKLKEG